MPSLIPSSEDVRIYECALLYPHPINQKEETQLLKEVEAHFEEVGAKLVVKDAWGRRGLAFPIKGFMEGNYVIYYFEMDPLKVEEVDNALKITKGVLRHMFVKPPKNYQVVKYSETYETWLKERESIGDKRTREKEEKLQERIAQKAKRQVAADKKAPKPEKAAPMQEAQLNEKLEKLISDDTFDL
jgi:ribosomal protein S6